MTERERQLDAIRKTSDDLLQVARRYDQIRWMAEKDTTSDAFINLAIAAGELTRASLEQTATLLEIMFNSQTRSQ